MPTEHATRVEVKDAHCHIALAPLPHESARNRRLLGWPSYFGVAKSKLIKPDSKHTITEHSTESTEQASSWLQALTLSHTSIIEEYTPPPPTVC